MVMGYTVKITIFDLCDTTIVAFIDKEWQIGIAAGKELETSSCSYL